MDSTNAMIKGQCNASMKWKKPEKAVNVKQEPVVRENEDKVEEED